MKEMVVEDDNLLLMIAENRQEREREGGGEGTHWLLTEELYLACIHIQKN